jgi:hypothetical protein
MGQLLASGVPRAAESAPRTLHLDLLGPTHQPCTACQHRMSPRCFGPNMDFAHMQCQRHSHSAMGCCRQLECRGQVGLRFSQGPGACTRHGSADASLCFNDLFHDWLTPVNNCPWSAQFVCLSISPHSKLHVLTFLGMVHGSNMLTSPSPCLAHSARDSLHPDNPLMMKHMHA